jgi:hypothetical protein
MSDHNFGLFKDRELSRRPSSPMASVVPVFVGISLSAGLIEFLAVILRWPLLMTLLLCATSIFVGSIMAFKRVARWRP